MQPVSLLEGVNFQKFEICQAIWGTDLGTRVVLFDQTFHRLHKFTYISTCLKGDSNLGISMTDPT